MIRPRFYARQTHVHRYMPEGEEPFVGRIGPDIIKPAPVGCPYRTEHWEHVIARDHGVELVKALIADHSFAGEIIIRPYIGTGTSICCERPEDAFLVAVTIRGSGQSGKN